MMKRILFATSFAGLFLLSSCSIWMEAQRPTPVNLDQFVVGEPRAAIVEKLGQPLTTATKPDGVKCDIYRLYTKGLNPGEKTAIAIGEGTADIATLGLAEIVLTPVEGATKNKKHPVIFYYKKSKLIRIGLLPENYAIHHEKIQAGDPGGRSHPQDGHQ